jgi:hypothetical protein
MVLPAQMVAGQQSKVMVGVGNARGVIVAQVLDVVQPFAEVAVTQ